jgi:hypothetical protein
MRLRAEALQAALASGSFRFDASDLMPPPIGDRLFFDAMMTYLAEGPDSLDRILTELDAAGSLRAADLAARLDIPANQASFHLRQLAKYGFVELAPGGSDRRARPWRLTDLEQRWSSSDPSPAADQLERVFIRREADRLLQWVAGGSAEPEPWQAASFLGGATVPLTATELQVLRDRIRAELEPFIRRASERTAPPPDARFVRILIAGTPLPASMAPGPTADRKTGDRP